jgi:hypothetical protein
MWKVFFTTFMARYRILLLPKLSLSLSLNHTLSLEVALTQASLSQCIVKHVVNSYSAVVSEVVAIPFKFKCLYICTTQRKSAQQRAQH